MTALALSDNLTTLVVLPWIDHDRGVPDHDPRSRYAELFVLPVLGPSALWLLRRLVDGLDTYPDGYELDLVQTAAALGLSYTPQRPGPFSRALQRCVMFGYANDTAYGIAVRRRIAALSSRQLERLPEHLRVMHAQMHPGRHSPR
jgi:hypothetical protein